MLQQKNTAIAKQQRRHMAELIGEKKLESARIRVENIIRSDIITELHEILELYCELLLARIQLLEQMPTVSSSSKQKATDETKPSSALEEYDLDPGLEEAVRAIVFAAPKTDIKELSLARALLIEKFGKDFALEVQSGTNVPERVLSRLRVDTPKSELVDAYLREICRTYGVHFPGDPTSEDETIIGEEEEEEEDDEEDGEGGARNKTLENPLQAEALERATPPRDSIGQPSPLRIAPPSPTTENVSPSVRLPGGDAKGVRPPPTARKASAGAATSGSAAGGKGKAKEKSSSAPDSGPGGKIPDVDELAKRFAALKRT
jgi:vacuolar protein sorting-associated protein IST1